MWHRHVARFGPKSWPFNKCDIVTFDVLGQRSDLLRYKYINYCPERLLWINLKGCRETTVSKRSLYLHFVILSRGSANVVVTWLRQLAQGHGFTAWMSRPHNDELYGSCNLFDASFRGCNNLCCNSLRLLYSHFKVSWHAYERSTKVSEGAKSFAGLISNRIFLITQVNYLRNQINRWWVSAGSYNSAEYLFQPLGHMGQDIDLSRYITYLEIYPRLRTAPAALKLQVFHDVRNLVPSQQPNWHCIMTCGAAIHV